MTIRFAALAVALSFQQPLFAGTTVEKTLTQYTRTVWTQANGLPQDAVRAIAQTSDGYLWLGTDEGLVRFDGYDFVIFNKDHGGLPSNSVSTLSSGIAGDLWIGTSSGIVHYQDRRFQAITKADGLPDDDVTKIICDHAGVVWVVAGSYLCRIDSGKITRFQAGIELPLAGIRTVYEDRDHVIWVAGYGGVARLSGGTFSAVPGTSQPSDGPIECLVKDRDGNLWMGSNRVRSLSRNGQLQTYSGVNLIPGRPVRSLWEDSKGNIWLGTNDGIVRFHNNGFESLSRAPISVHDRVRAIYEDMEGDLWVGTNTGLSQFRDDAFTVYSRAEGMPSDEPTSVLEDSTGTIWVGFQNAGLIRMGKDGIRTFNRSNGLPDDQVFSIRETPDGDLLIASRGGLSRLHGNQLTTFVPSHVLNRQLVFDSIQDRQGQVWIVNSDGLSQLVSGRFRNVLPGGLTLKDYMDVLCEGQGSVLWIGSRGNGLFRVDHGAVRHFTTDDGLSSNQIGALYEEKDGTLWVGTIGGGLNRFKDDRFFQYTTKQGLLSDNIAHIDDDRRGSLWLSTTRGICRLSKNDLNGMAAGTVSSLAPQNYGIEDGLRAQCGAGYPLGCEATIASDGRLWLPTGKGLAVLDPGTDSRTKVVPTVHLVEITLDHKNPIDPDRSAKFAAGTTDIQFRYSGIHLSSPPAVKYFYKLEDHDKAWIPAGKRRSISYANLGYGSYRFVVRSELKNGLTSETSYAFEILPHFYETLLFKILIAGILLAAAGFAYRMHLKQLRNRFTLVLEERTRIARELHDTLAQGFVGISSQLDASSVWLSRDPQKARAFLDLARGMTRHSLNEARRTVMDLRVSALEGQDLASALESETLRWTAGSNIIVHMDVSKDARPLSHEVEQHLLRIAQEAVTNALKHASAARLWVLLKVDTHKLHLRVTDDGRGCDNPDVSSPAAGHFGLIGMRERAQSIGGDFSFQSQPQAGTSIEVTVPLT